MLHLVKDEEEMGELSRDLFGNCIILNMFLDAQNVSALFSKGIGRNHASTFLCKIATT